MGQNLSIERRLVHIREQIRGANLEGMGEPDDHVQGRIAARSFYSTDVCAVQSRMMRKVLLRGPPLGFAEFANAVAKGDPMRRDRCHISNASLLSPISPRTMSHICVNLSKFDAEKPL